MRIRFYFILILIMIPAIGLAQEEAPVDRLISVLSDAIDTSTAWQMRDESGIDRSKFDSIPWRNILSLPYYNGHDKLVRYESTIVIPEYHAGTAIKPGKAVLEFSLGGPADFSAEVFVNGELVTTYPTVDAKSRSMEFPPVTLSESAKPGDTFVVQVRVHNPMIYPAQDYPLSSKQTSFGGAKLLLEQTSDREELLSAFLVNIYSARSLTTAWQLNTNDKRPFIPERISKSELQPEELAELAAQVNTASERFNFAALQSGNWSAIDQSMADVLAELKPVSDFAKSFTVYLVGNAHIDLAWLWRTRESVEIAANTFQSVLNNLAEFPELIYAQSQAQAYQWVKENRPQLFANIQKAAAEGSWDVVGGMWAEPDCNLISGESWIRQILYAHQYFKENFDTEVSLGWNPDSFGYNWNMPQFYSKSGIKAFITQKISWNHQTRFPWHLFWWEAPDGSRILTYLPPGSYVEKVEYKNILDQMLNFEHATGFREVLCLVGFGNHGGGPNVPMLERARLYNSLPLFPKVEFISAHSFIEKMFAKDLSNLPVWKSEMYLENHRGTLTTQAKTKRYNRELENLLITTEKLASIAALSGFEYPAELLESSWKSVLLNQFHDILPGSGITPVFHDAEESYAVVEAQLEAWNEQMIRKLAPETSADSGSETLTVFNPGTWQRSDIVKFALPAESADSFEVSDAATKSKLPSAVEIDPETGEKLLVYKTGPVEAMALKQFAIKPLVEKRVVETSESQLSMENQFLKVTVNPETGNISSIYDKELQKEIIARDAEANVIELHENRPGFWDAWNIGYTGRSWVLNQPDDVTLIENNSLRSVIRVKKSFLGLSKSNWAPTEGYPSSFFVQDIILYHDSHMVVVEMDIDWWEDHTLLKVAFPLAVQNDTATYEIPYANIERSTKRETIWEKARFEVPVHRWADLSQQDYGVSLINDSKYGMDIHNNIMRLTILTSPIWPDPMADRGKQTVSYAIYPHSGDWRVARTIQKAAAFNSPFPVVLTSVRQPFARAAAGNAPEKSLVQNFIKLSSDQLLISAIKQSHEGNALIVRIVELHGKPASDALQLSLPILSASEVTMTEKPLKQYTVNGNSIDLELKPYEIKTLKIKLDPH